MLWSDKFMNCKKITLWDLFFTFFKIGAFTIGGGLAMVSVIEKELVQKKKWIDENELFDMIAIAESTPGVIAINSATFIGYKTRKFLGALMATIGVVLPSVVIISLITFVFDWFLSFELVKYAFKGANAAVCVLILNAGIKLFKSCEKNAYNYAMTAFALVLGIIFIIFNVSTIIIIILGFIIGIFYYAMLDHVRKEGEKK